MPLFVLLASDYCPQCRVPLSQASLCTLIPSGTCQESSLSDCSRSSRIAPHSSSATSGMGFCSHAIFCNVAGGQHPDVVAEAKAWFIEDIMMLLLLMEQYREAACLREISPAIGPLKTDDVKLQNPPSSTGFWVAFSSCSWAGDISKNRTLKVPLAFEFPSKLLRLLSWYGQQLPSQLANATHCRAPLSPNQPSSHLALKMSANLCQVFPSYQTCHDILPMRDDACHSTPYGERSLMGDQPNSLKSRNHQGR